MDVFGTRGSLWDGMKFFNTSTAAVSDEVLVWVSVWSTLFAYGPADDTASPNPIVSCLIFPSFVE